MILQIVLFSHYLFFSCLYAQDERIFKTEFIFKLPIKEITKRKISFFKRGALYKIDLNNDLKDEGLSFVKSNGKDYLEILSSTNKILHKIPFDAVGISSRLFKVRYYKLQYTNILLLYYYEGEVTGVQTKSSVRLYIVNLDSNFLKISFIKGPMIWKGFLTFEKKYFEKKFKVIVKDSNFDGLRDIVIFSPHLRHVILQTKNHEWKII